MRVRTVKIECAAGDVYTIYPIGDIHLGSVNCDKKLLARTIKLIENDENAMWLGMGDMVEAISPSDKRWSGDGVDPEIVNLATQDHIGDVYVDTLSEMFAPIAGKCIGYSDGNHEQTFNKAYYTNISVRVLERLKRHDMYNQWAALTRVSFDCNGHRFPLRIFSQHGWQGGRTDGAKVNEARRLLSYITADIYASGHSHSKFVIPCTRLAATQKWTDVVDETVWISHTGSFLRTLGEHSGYAERGGYPPTTLGVVYFRVTVSPKNGLTVVGGYCDV